jgi:hypothetical protein
MALTKLPKNAIGTGAIDASKIEDSTLQAVEISGTISQDKITTGTIANNKLINSTFTIRGTSRALGDSFSLSPNVDWQSVITADGSTTTIGSAGKGYFINTTSAAHTFTLPVSATRGDTIAIKDYAGTFASNKLTINRNGHNIQGVANNSLIGTNRASLVLVYVDSTKGWLYAEEHNVANLQQFVAATGGTVLTDGDFKTHVFTGDGSFVVTNSGSVEYLVVAGGGGGGVAYGGGAGAGGLRTNYPSPVDSGLSVGIQTYPITVGGGGSGGVGAPTYTYDPNNGSPSIFSTITSAGGGYGGNYPSTPAKVSGGPGGSGGGASLCTSIAGSGNTPPVSPPQGNPGGSFSPGPQTAGSGGGGSSTSGFSNSTLNGGAGGTGTPISTTFFGPTAPSYGTPGPAPGRYFSGGGGGGVEFDYPTSVAGPGGSGGGGAGARGTSNATGGTANTGGGGGGSGNDGGVGAGSGGTGGKGIVVIRYKFQ